MDFKTFRDKFCDILPILIKAAPIIGTMIGSPATGTIVALLASIVNTNACDHTLIAKALKDDPDLFLKLQNLEATHSKWLQESF